MTYLLFALILALLIYLFYYKREIHSLRQQLDDIGHSQTNRLLTQQIYSKELSELVASINTSLKKERQARIDIQNQDQQQQAFLTHVSHDIRTPLTSLKGYIQLLEKEQDPRKRHHYHEVINQRLNDLDHLLEQLFRYMKLEDSDYQLVLQPMNFSDYLSHFLFQYYDLLEEKGIDLQLDLMSEPMSILAHEDLLEAILENLLKNAVRHGQGQVKIHLAKEDETLTLIVSNPIDSEEKIDGAEVFNRFYKTDSSRKIQSSGLGLSIVKSAVTRLKGKIQAQQADQEFQIIIHFPCCSK